MKINLIINHYINFKRKIWTWTGIWTRTSRSLVWPSAIELSWFLFQITFKLSSWNVCHFYKITFLINEIQYMIIGALLYVVTAFLGILTVGNMNPVYRIARAIPQRDISRIDEGRFCSEHWVFLKSGVSASQIRPTGTVANFSPGVLIFICASGGIFTSNKCPTLLN